MTDSGKAAYNPEAVRPGAEEYDGAVCGLPDCGAPLYMERTSSRAVYLTDTVADLRNDDQHSSSWQVVCGEGHTILVPPGTAEDNYTFGECRCEPTDPFDSAYCGHGDMDRLRRVIGEGADRSWRR